MLLAVAQAAAPAVQTIVKQVTVPVQVAVTPQYLIGLAHLAELAVPAYIASFAHDLVKGKSQKLQSDEYDWVNSLLLFTYAFVISGGVLYATGQFDVHNPAALGTALFTTIGAASARYAVLRRKQNASATTSTTSTEVPAQAGAVATDY